MRLVTIRRRMTTELSLRTTYANKVLKADTAGINRAAELLCQQKLVAFPTETVYGLGANALNEEAVKSIFVAKGRPLTDPLIVHVLTIEDARKLVSLTEEEDRIFSLLAAAFWPGPLTIIAKASSLIPPLVTAHTGFVGIRLPNHPIARSLLAATTSFLPPSSSLSTLAIAAPSANRFAHVSPTRCHHVLADLAERCDLAVLDGDVDDSQQQQQQQQQDTCKYGIESTVMKIDSSQQRLQIFRQGAVTKQQVIAVLKRDRSTQQQQQQQQWLVEIVNRNVKMSETTTTTTTATAAVVTPEVGQEAPGQAITHYSPDVPCSILNTITIVSDTTTAAVASSSLKTTVLLDYDGRLRDLYPFLLDYRDLALNNSNNNNNGNNDKVETAARNLFDFLRWAEQVPQATNIYIASLETTFDNSSSSSSSNNETNEFVFGVADRIHRAASGKKIDLSVFIDNK